MTTSEPLYDLPPPFAPKRGRRFAIRGLVGAAALGLLLLAFWPVLFPRLSPSYRGWAANNLKQIGLAVHNYHSQHKVFPGRDVLGANGEPGAVPIAWQTVLLPFMDQGALWKNYDATKRYTDPANAAVVGTEIDSYLIPFESEGRRTSEGGYGLSHHAGNVHVLGDGGLRSVAEVRDGAVTTILAGQVDGFYQPWADPSNLRDPAAGIGRSPQQFGGPHTGGTQMLMVDGSVNFFNDTIDPEVLAALGTPDGGEKETIYDAF